MKKLFKLQKGDKVAVISPSFAAPGKWPEVYEICLNNLCDVFGLEPVEFPATKKLGASGQERTADLVFSFEDPDIKAVFASIGGDDQVTYIKNLPKEPFLNNPKPFFGFSDNSHFCNFLFLNGIPSFYGASLFTQFSIQPKMDDFTVKYIEHALFKGGEIELKTSNEFCDSNLAEDGVTIVDWGTDSRNLIRFKEKNEGWFWEGEQSAEGLLWGGCIESIDEMLRHAVKIPSLNQFKDIVLMLETSEEMPTAEHVRRVIGAFGERGILERVGGVLVGRPKAWHFDHQHSIEQKEEFRLKQREVTFDTIKQYNPNIPVV